MESAYDQIIGSHGRRFTCFRHPRLHQILLDVIEHLGHRRLVRAAHILLVFHLSQDRDGFWRREGDVEAGPVVTQQLAIRTLAKNFAETELADLTGKYLGKVFRSDAACQAQRLGTFASPGRHRLVFILAVVVVLGVVAGGAGDTGDVTHREHS